jgi:hypothetical protein
LAAVGVVLVGGCSSGGGKNAIPTTTNITPTTKPGPPIGKCPTDPAAVESLRSSNAGIHGIAAKLVPINALRARVCNYTEEVSVVASAVLTVAAASHLEVETNVLRSPPGPDRGGCGGIAFLVVFASETRQVAVADIGCGVYAATNGVFSAFPSQTWVNELQRYTTGPTATVTDATGIVEGPFGWSQASR